MPRHIRNGETVMVTSGDDKGKTGTILQVIPGKSQVVVQGINVKSRHLKPSQASPQGGIIQKEMPIHWSKVSPVADGKATRVRFQTRKDGSKVKVAAVNGQELAVLHKGRKKK